MSLRLVFMGTPDFAVPTLAALVEAEHRIEAVYTRAPRPAGRGMAERKTPVHQAAELFGLPVLTPCSLKDGDAQETFRAHKADAAVVVAYGLLLPKPVLDAPRDGCFNLHASLLPRWRGAAPINRAIMAGDGQTGVAIMKMDEGLDTGAVALTERVDIRPDETAGELHDRLSRLGAPLMARAMRRLEDGELEAEPQPEDGVVYAQKLTNEETAVDWTRPARDVHNQIRGLSPFPGAWCSLDLGKGPERLKLIRTSLESAGGEPGTLLDGDGRVACGEGAVRLVTVQRAGKGPMAFGDFARGARLQPGARFL
ncbi:methionyl-tRNA formyltransferase [Terrihabitans rhizophilus]|uniref:Methionyl-tRNA formyltransferase n=1 Tax=Terrihabitans rhizophilus TaxID=3092662 RepID=A0ABU4RLF4_9HYPH|nr:methionyl-tRNA formyltransferase [Terrihabitans sp. PJ23]MDX6804480.1 methionyl-tRNA formyltransferase [Terrihabitans sp. PJ23]